MRMMGRFEFICRERDYAQLDEGAIHALYQERKEALARLGAFIPDEGDPVLDPGPMWLRVAFLDNVIRYEEGFGGR
jgi:hypothetical protein